MTIDPILPDPKDPRLSRPVEGVDENGEAKSISVIEERPLTIYLNSQEIVTAMTIGDHPEYLALGFLLNQGMLKETDTVTGIDFDEELEVAVVRTSGVTDVEDKLEKKTRTSGCAVGTVFGDMMAGLEGLSLPDTPVHTSTFTIFPIRSTTRRACTWKPAPSTAPRFARDKQSWRTWRMLEGTTRAIKLPAGCT